MDALRMAAALLSLGRDESPLDDAMTAIASFPTIVGTYWRLRNGEAPVPVRADLAHAAHYLHQLSGTEPSAERARALETYLNTVCDHGLNASTFAGRVIASTRSDVISAITGAVGALKGPLHGGAPVLRSTWCSTSVLPNAPKPSSVPNWIGASASWDSVIAFIECATRVPMSWPTPPSSSIRPAATGPLRPGRERRTYRASAAS